MTANSHSKHEGQCIVFTLRFEDKKKL